MDSTPTLAVQDLRVSLAGTRVLHGVNLEVQRGSWLGILGPNGAGKTTIIRAVAGMIPFGGQVRLLGRPLQEWSSKNRARHMALVAQSVPMYFDFTVLDLVLLGRAPHKPWLAPYHTKDREVAIAALRQVDLEHFEDRSMLTLSGGERRRALLAQALAQDAELLLLDEPTSHLDVHHQFDFMGHIRSLVDAGRTAVGVFHDLEMAARFADRLLVLDRGKVMALGPPDEALAPETIEQVFRMKAEVASRDGLLSIRYEGVL